VSEAREEVLRRVREALADDAGGEDVVVRRAYRRAGDLDEDGRVETFAERLTEYGATVVRSSDAREAIADVLAETGARRVVVAADLPGAAAPRGVELVVDDALAAEELDAADAVLTTCAAACAETGTLALDGGEGQGRRAITLVPDVHICLVRPRQIVQTVPELFDRLEASARDGRPIVLVSGPSATSDIELARVEGVHGPRRLVVVIAP
jgi:L-lactate dehydrogenase complex protein LldG